MSSQPVSVTLSEPVTLGSESISQLVVQPMKGKHLRALKGDPTPGDLLTMAEKLTGQPREVIDMLSAPDAFRLMEAVSSFFEEAAPPSTET